MSNSGQGQHMAGAKQPAAAAAAAVAAGCRQEP
jgi:hypothetical protein